MQVINYSVLVEICVSFISSSVRHEYLMENYELEQWIRDNMQAASSEDYGQDFEHLLVWKYLNIDVKIKFILIINPLLGVTKQI